MSSISQANPWRKDLPASVVVFLVALPLCLGIALASNAPLFSGIIAGVIGGIVVGVLGGSEVSVSGPAAGLTVIVVDSLARMGGNFEYFLAALVIAGGLQYGMGLLRAGTLVDYVPTSVVRGMLSAIGIVIILKQIPHALGYDRDPSGDMEFIQSADGLNTFESLLLAVRTFSPTALLIACISVAVLLLFDQKRIKKAAWSTYVPGPLVVVVLGLVLNWVVGQLNPGAELRAADKHLVQLPMARSVEELEGLFLFPDFRALFVLPGYVVQTALTLALVASLETLLSLEAADKLDPQKRISRKNRELRGQGMANLFSGLVGGLPVTSVIVRTSANVYAGAVSRRATVVHGVLLALSALLLPGLLNRIPLASLAVVLIFVGYKLASVKVFRAQYAEGPTQFIPFLITLVAIVFTDLLVGVIIGIVVGFVVVLRTLHGNAFTMVNKERDYLIRINKDLTFLHKNELKAKLLDLPDGARVLIDGNKATTIDTDIYLEVLDFLQQARYRGIEVELKHLRRQAPPHIFSKLPTEQPTFSFSDRRVDQLAPQPNPPMTVVPISTAITPTPR